MSYTPTRPAYPPSSKYGSKQLCTPLIHRQTTHSMKAVRRSSPPLPCCPCSPALLLSGGLSLSPSVHLVHLVLSPDSITIPSPPTPSCQWEGRRIFRRDLHFHRRTAVRKETSLLFILTTYYSKVKMYFMLKRLSLLFIHSFHLYYIVTRIGVSEIGGRAQKAIHTLKLLFCNLKHFSISSFLSFQLGTCFGFF